LIIIKHNSKVVLPKNGLAIPNQILEIGGLCKC
jgi:hypothetical protein